MLKKHDTELEEDINSAESAHGRMTDTLGSDNYPGLIRRDRGIGMPGRQVFGCLQPQTQVQNCPVRLGLPDRLVIQLLPKNFRILHA